MWDGSALWPGDGGYVFIPSNHLFFFKYDVNETTAEPELSFAGGSKGEQEFGSGAPIVTSNGSTSGSGVVWLTTCLTGHTGCEVADLAAYRAAPTEPSPKPIWSKPIGAATKFARPDAYEGHIYVGNAQGDLLAFSPSLLTSSTESLDLGSIQVGGQAGAQVTLENKGTPLKIKEVRAPTAPFTATGLPAVGEVIQPGRVINITATFHPTGSGAFGSSFGVVTEAGETVVALSGSATTPSPRLEEGSQNLRPFATSAKTDSEATLRSALLDASSSGAVVAEVSCSHGAGPCEGTVALQARASEPEPKNGRSRKHGRMLLTLAVGRFDVAAGTVRKVTLHLSTWALRLLDRKHRLQIQATVLTVGKSGVTHTSETTIVIRRPRTRRHGKG